MTACRPKALQSVIAAYFGHLPGIVPPFYDPRMALTPTGSLQSSADLALAAARIKFVTHQGRRVLFLDYSQRDAAGLNTLSEEGHRVISREPPNSLLTLTDVTGTSFDQESVELLKARVAANAPYVRRAAVVGLSGLQRLIYEAVKLFTKRNIRAFSTRQEALDWLIKD